MKGKTPEKGKMKEKDTTIDYNNLKYKYKH